MATTSGNKRPRPADEDESMDVTKRSGGSEHGGGMGPSGPDGRFISLLAPSFRIRTTRRILNTITEGQFFFPLYMYMLPYCVELKEGATAFFGPINQEVDYLISRVTPLFHQVSNFKTSMRISHIQSSVTSSSDANQVDTIAGNNSPFLNIGRDSLNSFKSLPCSATDKNVASWDESALQTNDVWSCMHNGGVYTSVLPYSDTLGFGAQGPYSAFGEIQTLQSGLGSSYSKHNHYTSPDGHTFVVPSIKSNLGNSQASFPPTCVPRFPFPTTQQGPVNDSATGPGSNPPDSLDSVLRKTTDIPRINLNTGGEAIVLWVNRINPALPASATTSQKLQISFMMELTMECDVKVNYNSATVDLDDSGLFNDGYLTQGKVAAMPCQNTPITDVNSYWAFGDALRPCHKNNL